MTRTPRKNQHIELNARNFLYFLSRRKNHLKGRFKGEVELLCQGSIKVHGWSTRRAREEGPDVQPVDLSSVASHVGGSKPEGVGRGSLKKLANLGENQRGFPPLFPLSYLDGRVLADEVGEAPPPQLEELGRGEGAALAVVGEEEPAEEVPKRVVSEEPRKVLWLLIVRTCRHT